MIRQSRVRSRLPDVCGLSKAVELELASRHGDGSVHVTKPVSAVVSQISAEMVKAKEAREDFELRDLRRTAETMLASLKVPGDVRA